MVDRAVRAAGLLLIAGAVLGGAAIVVATTSAGGNPGFSTLGDLLLLFSSLLLTLSLPAMYAKQARGAGWVGLVGHALLQIGFLLFLVVASPHLRNPGYNPLPEGDNAVDGLLAVALALGLLLTGIAIVRAGIYPRWTGILLLVSTASFFFGFFVAEALPAVWGQTNSVLLGLLLSLGLGGIGAVMLRDGLAEGATVPPQALLLPADR